MKKNRMIIDDHNHPNWHGMTVDDLVKNMDQNGIAKTWLLSWEMPKEEFEAAPTYYECMDPRGLCAQLWMVMEGVNKYPDRFIPGYAPDPRDRYARAKLKSAVKLYGVKVYGEFKYRMRYDNPDAIAMYHFCGELGLPVLIHLECPPMVHEQFKKDIYQWPEWYGGDMTTVETMCRMCPETNFIGHAPGFWREISGDADIDPSGYPTGPVVPGGRLQATLRKYPNLYCDLSAGSGANSLRRDLKNGREFVLEFQDRILFGRDYYDHPQMDVLEKLDLPEDVLEKVFHLNAEKLTENAGKSIIQKEF
jgi:predicted TIM-barrel fold metal-dependent hydrolase